jgi:drug/metabolite transporter (DMT)-like permease
MSRRLQADLLLLVICVAWGATFVLEQAALRHVSTLLFLLLRFAVAGVVLIACGGNPFRHFQAGALAGLFLFLGCALQAQGLRLTTPSKSAFITGLCVILVPLFQVARASLPAAFPESHEGQPARMPALLGAFLALIGLALLTGVAHQNVSITSITLFQHRGDLWTLACAFAFAIHILLMGHYSSRCRPLDLAAGQVLTALLLGALTFWWVEPIRLESAPSLWWAVAITGLICTAAAYVVQAWAQQFTTPSHTALIFSSEPVFAWITSALVLGERLGAGATAGALLILAGILLAELLGRPEGIQA